MKILKKVETLAKEINVGDVFTTQHGARQLIGGKSYGETKFVTIDLKTGSLKSRIRDTKEEVLAGYKVEEVSDIKPNVFVVDAEVIGQDFELEVGDVFLGVDKNNNTFVRKIAGGKSYGVTKFFTFDPLTGERKSKFRDSIAEVLEGYKVIMPLTDAIRE
jgi:hypothetical protein